MESLKIGAMAKACGVTPRALRLYQQEGILQPEIVDRETGYRSYSINQSMKLDMIIQLQNAGFTLRDIARIQEEGSVDYLEQCCEQQSAEFDRQIEDLLKKKRAADAIAQGCRQYDERSMCGSIMLERLPERRIIVLDAPTMSDLGGSGDYTDNERWEWYQQHAKRQLAQRGYPLSLFRCVGCYVPADEVSSNINLLFSRPFVFVDPTFGDLYENATVLPACVCLTAYYDTCHKEDGSDFDTERVRRVLDKAAQENLEIAGPFTYESIFRFMRLFNEDAHAYFRHVLPVRRVSGA